MDTRAVADQLRTDTKTLRRFLRSSASSVEPVGSGGRYTFTEDQLDTIRTEFEAWSATVTDKPAVTAKTKPRAGKRKRTQEQIDQAVWDEEGPVFLPDIRKPEVRQAVRAAAAARVERLEAKLREAGLHVSQVRDRVPA